MLSSADWPRAGTMRNGSCWARATLEHRTAGNDAGFSERVPTPRNSTGRDMSKSHMNLDGYVKLFPTPVTKGLDGGSNSRAAAKKRNMWITPSASDATRGGTITEKMTGGSLAQQVNTPSMFPTPTVNGNNNRKGLSKTSGDGLATRVGGMLNPAWVDWLMGLPIDWTALDRSATPKFHFAPPPHGTFCSKEQTNERRQ